MFQTLNFFVKTIPILMRDLSIFYCSSRREDFPNGTCTKTTVSLSRYTENPFPSTLPKTIGILLLPSAGLPAASLTKPKNAAVEFSCKCINQIYKLLNSGVYVSQQCVAPEEKPRRRNSFFHRHKSTLLACWRDSEIVRSTRLICFISGESVLAVRFIELKYIIIGIQIESCFRISTTQSGMVVRGTNPSRLKGFPLDFSRFFAQWLILAFLLNSNHRTNSRKDTILWCDVVGVEMQSNSN